MLNLSKHLRYKSGIGFTDLLFNLVIGFVYLFIIAFILINPVAKKGDITKKAEYLIIIEWNENYNDDVDLWIKDPSGNILSFLAKSSGLMHLEKDDLGFTNDTFTKNGKTEVLPINREVATLRGTVEGEYEVMAHVYNRKFTLFQGKPRTDLPAQIVVQIIKINPYMEAYTGVVNYIETGQALSLVRFRLGEEGSYLGNNNTPSDFVTREKRGGSPNGRYELLQ